MCGGPAGGRPVYRRGPWRVWACRRCGHGWTVPRPEAPPVEAYGTDDYFRERGMTSVVEPGHRGRARWLRERFGKGRLLDVGCGMGALLAAARDEGFDVLGTDLSPRSAAAAEALGVSVRVGPFGPELLQGAGPFDVVTLIHVAEHLPGPGDALALLRRHLAPGGRLVVEVPNRAAAGARVPGPVRRKIYDLPHHLHHFTPASLERLLTDAGFQVEGLAVALPGWIDALLGTLSAWRRGTPAAGGPGGSGAAAGPGAAARSDGLRAPSPGEAVPPDAPSAPSPGQVDAGSAGSGSRPPAGDPGGPSAGRRLTALVREVVPGWKMTAVARAAGKGPGSG